MYSIYDYVRSGLVFANNMMRRRRKKLTSLMIYSTTSCQSRCKHCSTSFFRRYKENDE